MLDPHLLYFVLIMIAAAFSQLAQFGHLKYAESFSTVGAVVFAILLASIEYGFSVPANRLGKKTGITTPQLSIVWYAGMLFFNVLLQKYLFNVSLTKNDYIAYGLIFTGVLVKFL